MTPTRTAVIGAAAGVVAPFAYMFAHLMRSPHVRGAVMLRVRRLICSEHRR